MRALVLAHGDGRRWANAAGRDFLDQPKHFVDVDGETLISRLVRQLADLFVDVIVVGPDDRYRFDDARLVTLDHDINGCGSDMGKFLDTEHLWSPTERTVILWGDCYYDDDLLAAIVAHNDDRYHVWRRPGRSEVTGARWDESFAVSFGPAEHDAVTTAARFVADLVTTGQLKSSHIRTHMVAMCGHTDPAVLDDLDVAADCPNQTHVDGWSDDFDSPNEWREWMRRRFHHDGHRVGVCIPWSPADVWRNSSHRWCLEWWDRLGVDVFIGGDRTDGRFPNRSAMRNDAARQASAAGCDVLFFADSDTFVSPEQFWSSVCLAVHRQQLVLAFSRYVRVTRQATSRLMRRGFDLNDRSARHLVRRAYKSNGHISGALAVPAALFTETGGYDERFSRWGYEDRAFHLAACTLAGDAPRIPGDAYHWFHPPAVDRDRNAPDSIEAARLARRYYIAAAWVPEDGAVQQAIELGLVDPIVLADDAGPDVAAVRSLLAEPGGPLAVLAPTGGQ
jgi:molybdopterin-guanine dinucleotide biosynthesis protein A